MQLSHQHRIIALANELGVIRPRDIEAEGIPREYLLRLVRRGVLDRIGRGLYRLPDAPITEFHSLVEVGKRLPAGTICLLSALSFHEITTQIPHAIWVSLPRGTRTPKGYNPKLEVVRVAGLALTEGREQHRIEGVPMMIYSAAKTVADCFKFRNRIGLDVAMEALRECVHERKATIAEIWSFAKICRVDKVMQPYLEFLQ